MATVDPDTMDALNLLLEDERASVEIEVALANGATTLHERETLTELGSENVENCYTLRDALTRIGDDVSRRINGIVLHILGLERYDDRLRAYAQHQASVHEHAEELSRHVTDRELLRILQHVRETSQRAAEWSSQRADEFSASALLDFRTKPAPATAKQGGERESGSPEPHDSTLAGSQDGGNVDGNLDGA